VSDLSPLRALPDLRELYFNATAVTSIEALYGTDIEVITMDCIDVNDLNPLLTLPLKSLWTGEITAEQFNIVLRIETLEHLAFTNTANHINDLTFLKPLYNLRYLAVDGEITAESLRGIEALPSLLTLTVNGTDILNNNQTP
jgi:hypothetical protein